MEIVDTIKNADCRKINFVGNVINKKIKMFLMSDRMDYVIDHNMEYELSESLNLINAFYKKELTNNIKTNILIYNKYNCLDEENIF